MSTLVAVGWVQGDQIIPILPALWHRPKPTIDELYLLAVGWVQGDQIMPILPALWHHPKPTVDEHLGGFQADQFTGLPMNLFIRLSPTLPVAGIARNPPLMNSTCSL